MNYYPMKLSRDAQTCLSMEIIHTSKDHFDRIVSEWDILLKLNSHTQSPELESIINFFFSGGQVTFISSIPQRGE